MVSAFTKIIISFDDNWRNTSLICPVLLGFKVDLFQNRPQIPTFSSAVISSWVMAVVVLACVWWVWLNLQFFRNEEKLEKLGDFTTDFVLEVTAKLLNEIHGQNEKPFKNVKPPQSMSARYNLASKMAEILANLDYPSQDLGYQTFLYSSENELRKLKGTKLITVWESHLYSYIYYMKKWNILLR